MLCLDTYFFFFSFSVFLFFRGVSGVPLSLNLSISVQTLNWVGGQKPPASDFFLLLLTTIITMLLGISQPPVSDWITSPACLIHAGRPGMPDTMTNIPHNLICFLHSKIGRLTGEIIDWEHWVLATLRVVRVSSALLEFRHCFKSVFWYCNSLLVS